MVSLSLRISLSVLFLITRASHLYADCCQGDVTCSGCWMCEGSALRECFDTHTNSLQQYQKSGDLAQQADFYCTTYSKLAQCWYAGVCCTEFAPSLAGATNICNLRTWPADKIPSSLLDQAVAEAETVRLKIYHNDSGFDIPKLSVHIKAYDDITESTESGSYSSQSASRSKSSSSSSYSSKRTQTEEHSYSVQTSGAVKSQDKQVVHTRPQSTEERSVQASEPKPEANHTKQQSESTAKSDSEKRPQHSSEYKPKPNADHHDKHKGTLTENSHKIHHHAKCNVEHHKCQKTIASQYHLARHQHSKPKLLKRDATLSSNPPNHHRSVDNVQLWKRTNLIITAKAKMCGISFQGIPYPNQIPKSVQHIFQ